MTISVEPIERALDEIPAPVASVDGHLLRIIAGGRPATGRTPGRVTRERAERYRQFLDALGVAVYTTDADGRITFFNEAAAAFWGRRPLLGEMWCGSLKIFTSDGAPLPHDECPMAVALKENRPIRGAQAIAERPDGSRVAFVPYPTPLREDGRLIGAVNVLIDVTERAQAEAALRETAMALAASNAVKDEFLGLVSHELRTPVTTIFGNARLLHDRGDSLDAALRSSMIGDIAEDAERLHAIIENLLHLTKVGSGQAPELEPQVLDRVARRAIDGFSRQRPERRVVQVGTAGGVIVDADETWLGLVIGNLLTNADKYSPPETSIEVGLAVVDGEVRLSVLDRGIGLGGLTLDDLFEPFFRAPEARSVATGIGIGLTVCKRIVETLGGRMWAQSRDGGGAEVGFALPVAAEPLA